MAHHSAIKKNRLLINAETLEKNLKNIKHKKPGTKQNNIYDSIHAKFKNGQN